MQEMIELILNNGILVVIAGMVLYFGFKLSEIFIGRLSEDSEKNLMNHNLFSYLDTSVNIYIDSITFSEDKKLFLRILLKEKFSTFSKTFKKFLEQDISSFSKDCLEKENIEILNKATLEYEANLLRMGYPHFLLEKFKDWHQPHVRGVVDGIVQICSSGFFTNNTMRQAAIFYSYFGGFHSTIVDARTTLDQLNGTFTTWVAENQEIVDKIKNYEQR